MHPKTSTSFGRMSHISIDPDQMPKSPYSKMKMSSSSLSSSPCLQDQPDDPNRTKSPTDSKNPENLKLMTLSSKASCSHGHCLFQVCEYQTTFVHELYFSRLRFPALRRIVLRLILQLFLCVMWLCCLQCLTTNNWTVDVKLCSCHPPSVWTANFCSFFFIKILTSFFTVLDHNKESEQQTPMTPIWVANHAATPCPILTW